jgi:hypothetical protein
MPDLINDKQKSGTSSRYENRKFSWNFARGYYIVLQ